MIVLIILLVLVGAVGTTLLSAFFAMVFEGALASSMGYVIPTLSYESSIWLVLLFGVLGAVSAASSRVGSD